MQTICLLKEHGQGSAEGAPMADGEPPPMSRRWTHTAVEVFVASEGALAGALWAQLSEAG